MRNKIYFASDFHLGADGLHTSKKRELFIVNWLKNIADSAQTIFLLGDIFDYWYEYKSVIPKGYSHFFSQLRVLRDADIDIQIFTGNHDVWLFDYLTSEYGIPVHRSPLEITIQSKKVLLAHGDGLGPGDNGYKILKKVFTNKFSQWLWSRLHPNFALYIMQKTSSTSRKYTDEQDGYKGLETEWLTQYAELKQSESKRDYYIFGHRHMPIDYTLSDGHSRYINLGDWLYNYTYAEMENGKITLKSLSI